METQTILYAFGLTLFAGLSTGIGGGNGGHGGEFIDHLILIYFFDYDRISF